jgi:hypothetical protein
MDRAGFYRQIVRAFLLPAIAALVSGCAGLKQETVLSPYPSALPVLHAGEALPEEGETIFDQEAEGETIFDQPELAQTEPQANGETPYEPAAGSSYDSYDPYYCDPFLGEPFCSYYASIHDPYWYYYNAYLYPYYSYYPYYYYPYYGYRCHDDDHHHKKSFWHSFKHRGDDRKDVRDTITGRVNERREKRKDRWEEIENAIREQRDACVERWQDIREQAQDRREERIEQWRDFSARVQDRIQEIGEERRERWNTFLSNAGTAFSRIGGQRRDFFKEHGLFRNDNHQPLFNRGDTSTGGGLFNGGLLRGLGGRR